MENYQGSTNQLGIFDQPEPRHQLLLDNRQRLRGLTSFRHRGHNGSVTTRQRPGQQGSQSQKLMVALPEMLHEGGQTEKQHSEAIVPLLSTQHTGTLTNQTSLSADRLVVKEQSYGVQCVWTCYCTCRSFPSCSLCVCDNTYVTYAEQMRTRMLLRHLSMELCGKQNAAVHRAPRAAVMQYTWNAFLTAFLPDNPFLSRKTDNLPVPDLPHLI